MARGGYRKPSNPAPVSGPGKLSRRTDGGPTQAAKYIAGGQYGEGKQLLDTQRSAPMAKAQPAQPIAAPKLTPLFAPTNLPSEPVTSGMPFGPGFGPEGVTAQAPDQNQSLSSILSKMLANDPTGEINDLYDYLSSRGL